MYGWMYGMYVHSERPKRLESWGLSHTQEPGSTQEEQKADADAAAHAHTLGADPYKIIQGGGSS